MIWSILTFQFRNFFRNISFSSIVLSSLVVGITTSLLLFLWVKHEFNYNKSVIDHDRVFALLINDEVEGEIHTEEGTDIPLMDFLSHDVPEIEAVSRVNNKNMMLANGEKSIHKTGVYADSSFFTVHVTERFQGNVKLALTNNRSIALSETLAKELFGDTPALGKTILVDRKTEFVVSAVYAPYPYYSSFNYINFVLPVNAGIPEEWTNHDIKLYDASSREKVEAKINQKIVQLFPTDNTTTLLFSVSDWRLRWSFENGKQSGGRIVYVVIFAITGLFVLIMASINYMNISTARATKRMREIGVRKVTGATQRLLVRQFMTESLVMTSLAALLSLVLAYLLLPLFNQLVGLNLPLVFSLSDPWLIVGLLFIVLFTTLLAGSYPAWVLSSINPAQVLKSNAHMGMGGAGFRKALVVLQFSLSVGMIFCALVVWQQTDFLLKKDLGYDKQRVINIWLEENLNPSFDAIREKVISHTAIESAALSGASPMEVNGYADCNRVVAPFPTPLPFYGVNVDEHVLTTLKFEFVEGRNFSHEHASDVNGFIITQRAAELLGFKNPIGQRIKYNMYEEAEGEIVGVVKDFQNDDIHTPIKPVVFTFGKPEYLRNLLVRYREGHLEEALKHINQLFEELQPGIPLYYSFLDSDFENQLYHEKMLSNISIAVTVIAITIACLGLFGLVLFNAQRRTKEIGIRKVLGASVTQVTVMLCRDFIPPVLYAFVIALPLASYFMQKFLETYTSRIALSVESFLLVAGTMLLLVLITASYQSVKAAQQNPVDSLKTE